MNATLEEGPEPAYAAFFGCILAVGLPLNAVSLWILLRHHSLKSPSAVYMVNLAISDLLLAISLPLRVYFYAMGTWPLSTLACHSVSMLFRNNIRSSALFITIISVDRLLAVVYPLRSRHLRTSSNAWKAAALIWLFVIVTNVPESVKYFIYLNNTNESSCFKGERNSKSIMIYLQLALVLSMLAVNIVCTALVSWTLNRHLNDSTRINNKVNVMLIFVMSLVMFIVCFLPLCVGLLVKTTSEEIIPLVCLTSVNCCLDPLLYYFSFDAFWKKKDNADLPG
ncbi:lysophosphatidic acid receptor 6-like [Cheilinus undulatus]|uniref:lysophosphatidic acid receptor 6-like n=1 Tax=Cheilinus undulatus TaxID=241271 RepID=UPI001BD61084|nr:lysophosphatidic acid receptor 6-like [Cheilinus undulatus]